MALPDLTKLAESIAETVSQPDSPCPHCGKLIMLRHVAQIPAKQILHMKLESETGHFSAKTIGGVITEFDKLLKAVAKDVGGKVHVFVDSVERSEKSLDVGFLITAVSEQKK